MAFHTRSSRQRRCTKRRQQSTRKQQRRQQQQQQKRRQQHFQRGGMIRDGSRFPAVAFTNQPSQLSDTHSACAHARWTGEIA